MEPGALYWFAGQEKVHADWPVAGLYFPAAQGEQKDALVALAVALYLPAAQAVQLAEDVAEGESLHVPAGQGCRA